MSAEGKGLFHFGDPIVILPSNWKKLKNYPRYMGRFTIGFGYFPHTFPTDVAVGSRILPIGSPKICHGFHIHLNGLRTLKKPYVIVMINLR